MGFMGSRFAAPGFLISEQPNLLGRIVCLQGCYALVEKYHARTLVGRRKRFPAALRWSGNRLARRLMLR